MVGLCYSVMFGYFGLSLYQRCQKIKKKTTTLLYQRRYNGVVVFFHFPEYIKILFLKYQPLC